jgi:Cu(I)/Ag(I) efflux system membrane fusion protein
MKKQISILALSLSLISFGVDAQHSHTKEKNQTSEKAAAKANPEFSKQLEAVYKANLDLNEAFVASDAQKVKAAVKPVKDAVAKVNMNLLKDKAHQDWMAYSKDMDKSLKQIEDAENIKEQRKHFSTYNESLYKSIKAFGIGEEEAYFQHCPMALNNEGASWISNSKEVKNPYFGDKMLKCGVIKETL